MSGGISCIFKFSGISQYTPVQRYRTMPNPAHCWVVRRRAVLTVLHVREQRGPVLEPSDAWNGLAQGIPHLGGPMDSKSNAPSNRFVNSSSDNFLHAMIAVNRPFPDSANTGSYGG